ncbi:MAG: protein kinase [Clostridia bacterium]|nr:protein kinase [Clostridia bacterium]
MAKQNQNVNHKNLIGKGLRSVRQEFDRVKKGTPYQHYRITDFIDRGGYAEVYKVESRFPGPTYAIRISVDTGEKYARELNVIKQLMIQGQTHIVEYLMVFKVKSDDDVLCCTLMNLLCPLSKYKNQADNIELAVRCASDLLPVLQVFAENRILHRDIKPQNIFYQEDFRNETGFLLGDFGEARFDRTGTVTGIGTPATVSPEIYVYEERKKADHHLSDMYSLGIVMYYYLNGRVYPFGNDHDRRLHTKGALPAPRYGSDRLKKLVIKSTQYDPKDRFASPQEMLNELRECDEYAQYILCSGMSGEETIVPVKSQRKIKTGDTLHFGRFPQTANGVVKPLLWRVLDVKDGKALLIADKLILCKSYHDTLKDITWENCSLRKWLNGEFLQLAFGTMRPSQLALVTNRNRENPKYRTKGGNDTNDRVFLLSTEEVNRYFSSDKDRIAQMTDYVNHQQSPNKAASKWWWLRTPGDYGTYAACVNEAGSVRELGRNIIDKDIAVRPAVWIVL